MASIIGSNKKITRRTGDVWYDTYPKTMPLLTVVSVFEVLNSRNKFQAFDVAIKKNATIINRFWGGVGMATDS